MWSIGSKEHSTEVCGGSAPHKQSAKVLQALAGEEKSEQQQLGEAAGEFNAKAYGGVSEGEHEGEEVLKKQLELTDQAYLQMSKKNFELYAKQLLNRKELNQLMREVQKQAFKDDPAKPGTRNTPNDQRKGAKSPIDAPGRKAQHKNQKGTGVVLPVYQAHPRFRQHEDFLVGRVDFLQVNQLPPQLPYVDKGTTKQANNASLRVKPNQEIRSSK